MAEQSLKEKTVKGTFWSAADAFLGQGVTFIVGLVLARLLSPAEYGLIGICTIFTTVLTSIVDSGFSNALIRKKDTTNEDFNTMFITNMVVSVVLYVVLYACSPLIAKFFKRLELVWLVRAMGLILIFQALSLVQNTILTKKIDFKTKTKASLYSAILSGIIGISMAFAGFGVWSIVGQQLSKQLLYSMLLWVFNRWVPSFSFSINSFRYMWGFGWKLMVSGILYNIWNQLYQLVVGKFYSPATLGQYSRSKDYANIFSQNLTIVVQRVSYPVLAEIQNDKERMVSAYRKIIKTTMFVTVVCMFTLGAVSEPLIYCLIGAKWHEAATYLPLMCISMSLYPLHSINLNMIQLQGRSDVILKLEIIKKVISIGPLILGIFINIYWMLIGSIVSGIISFILNSYYSGKELGYTSWMQLKDASPSLIIAFLVSLSVYYLKFINISYWIVLPLQLILASLVFFALCEKTKLPEYTEVKDIIKHYFKKMFVNQ